MAAGWGTHRVSAAPQPSPGAPRESLSRGAKGLAPADTRQREQGEELPSQSGDGDRALQHPRSHGRLAEPRGPKGFCSPIASSSAPSPRDSPPALGSRCHPASRCRWQSWDLKAGQQPSWGPPAQLSLISTRIWGKLSLRRAGTIPLLPPPPTLQWVVLMGRPTLEAITTVRADASSMLKPLQRQKADEKPRHPTLCAARHIRLAQPEPDLGPALPRQTLHSGVSSSLGSPAPLHPQTDPPRDAGRCYGATYDPASPPEQ